MRLIIGIFLTCFMTACSSQGSNPEARIDIQASSQDQATVIEAMKEFGKNNGFEVFVTDNLPKQGRLVSQVFLKRSDGVLVVMSNFMKADILETTFHKEKPAADWASVKEMWLKKITEVLGGRGEIIETPVGPPPSYVEEAHKKQQAAPVKQD